MRFRVGPHLNSNGPQTPPKIFLVGETCPAEGPRSCLSRPPRPMRRPRSSRSYACTEHAVSTITCAEGAIRVIRTHNTDSDHRVFGVRLDAMGQTKKCVLPAQSKIMAREEERVFGRKNASTTKQPCGPRTQKEPKPQRERPQKSPLKREVGSIHAHSSQQHNASPASSAANHVTV